MLQYAAWLGGTTPLYTIHMTHARCQNEWVFVLYFEVVNFILIFVTYSYPHLWGLTWGPYDVSEPIWFSWIFFANYYLEEI